MPQQTDTSGIAGAQQNGAPVRAIGDSRVAYEVLRFIPEESAEHYGIVPLDFKDGVLEVGMTDPDNIQGIDALNFITRKTGVPFKIFKISSEDLNSVLKMYRGLGGDVDQALSDLQVAEGTEKKGTENDAIFGAAAPLDLNDALAGKGGQDSLGSTIQEDAPTIKIFSTIMRYAIDGNASDVHIEPMTSGVRVRYRVDGDLHTSVILPINTHRALVARVKVLASIRLDEQRKPQDGRFSASIDKRNIDFRVSTFPSYNGEKVVIRILDRDRGYIPLDKLGLTPRNLEIMRRAINKPHGLILISGPTGSGKSTTLYSLLAEVDREHKNVLSLEDPIEYYVDGVTQSQVKPEIGYSFATGLRTTLRQDPDVIMVGEIRDGETARLAIQAALTGHLVLSTIHTNDAIGTVPRLIDMGVEPYLIPPTLVVSIAQRLVRTLCPEGGQKRALTESERLEIEAQQKGLPAKHRFDIPTEVYEAMRTPGCPSGMRGRMAVFEVLEMSSEIERIVLDNPVDSKLWNAARADGMLTMREDAIIKSINNQIPYSEVNTLRGLMLSEVDELQEELQTKNKKKVAEETTDTTNL